ncbi:MAG: hypothetical protein V5B39_04015 [Accumulibacter sp.]|jgi:hypothetical protein|uniref:hypothetical protein n=1 Tax=Accumulibacter sp. TaxID=2053492 RepID=UPI002FC2AC21
MSANGLTATLFSSSRRTQGLWLTALLAVLVGGLFGWQHFAPVTAANGWSFRVYLDGIPHVSALAKDRQGALYISKELGNGRGILFSRAADGSLTQAVVGLSKPDGLVAFRDGIAISQEGGDLPVLWRHDGQMETLFQGRSVEGLATDGQSLYAIEDRPGDGRLLRFDPLTRALTVLRSGLSEAEGVAICPDGQLFYTEKGKRWVKRWQAEGADVLVLEQLNAPGFLMCNDEGLWITEDATHRARLLLLDRSGSLQTVLSGLRSGQTVLPLAPGHLLLAEQGRGRVLEVERLPIPSR